VFAAARKQLTQWYGALKVLVVSWEEDEHIACLLISMYGLDAPNDLATVFPKLASDTRHLLAERPVSFPRLELLERELLEAQERSTEPFRGIVFVNQRITTHALKHFIENSPRTNGLFRPTVVYAATTGASPTLSVPAGAQNIALNAFKKGLCNLLICTVAAEEGVDVPAANCVIRFDAIQNSVSLMQGRGRGRQEGAQHIVLAERDDRTVEHLEAAESIQRAVCGDYSVKPLSPADKAAQLKAETAAQESRERNAIQKLEQRISASFDGVVNQQNAVALLNQISKATKVDLVEVPGKACYTLIYDSVLRQAKGHGQDSKKKTAKRKAAVELLEHLRSGMRQKF